ncbi:MAG: hypothetical protein KGJ13_11415, partial [Patescibacteria group bacterium]|nr:hypothetical protein [Patescibacteria group bacterium]
GTGVYRIEVRKNNRIWKRSDMRIMVPEKINATAPNDLSAVIVAAVNAANAKTHSLLEKMLEKSLTAAAPQPAFNPVEMFAGIGTIMANFQKMIPQPAPTPQIIEAPNPAHAMKEVMDLFKQGVEFAQTINPTEHSSGMTGILERLLESPLLAKIADGIQAPAAPKSLNLPPPRQPVPQGAPSPAMPIAAPAPLPAAQGQEQVSPLPEASQEEMGGFEETTHIPEISPSIQPTPQEFMLALQSNPQLQANVNQAIQYLLSRASKGSDPGYYADWVLDNWPPELIDVMIEMPDLTNQLQAFVPDIVPHRTWFQSLIDEVRKIVKDEDGQVNGEDIHAPAQPAATINAHGDTGR